MIIWLFRCSSLKKWQVSEYSESNKYIKYFNIIFRDFFSIDKTDILSI